MNKHTQGEWRHESGEILADRPINPKHAHPYTRPIKIATMMRNLKASDANARLIAAAPVLLAVAKELEESASYWSEYDVPLGIVDRLRAAIAKATGDKATAAWADVPNVTEWLEDLRGNTGKPT